MTHVSSCYKTQHCVLLHQKGENGLSETHRSVSHGDTESIRLYKAPAYSSLGDGGPVSSSGFCSGCGGKHPCRQVKMTGGGGHKMPAWQRWTTDSLELQSPCVCQALFTDGHTGALGTGRTRLSSLSQAPAATPIPRSVTRGSHSCAIKTPQGSAWVGSTAGQLQSGRRAQTIL